MSEAKRLERTIDLELAKVACLGVAIVISMVLISRLLRDDRRRRMPEATLLAVYESALDEASQHGAALRAHVDQLEPYARQLERELGLGLESEPLRADLTASKRPPNTSTFGE
jgi:hypothetical protein